MCEWCGTGHGTFEIAFLIWDIVFIILNLGLFVLIGFVALSETRWEYWFNTGEYLVILVLLLFWMIPWYNAVRLFMLSIWPAYKILTNRCESDKEGK